LARSELFSKGVKGFLGAALWLSFAVVSSSRAQDGGRDPASASRPPSQKPALLDGKETDLLGAIPNTTFREIESVRRDDAVLRPKHGFRDIFMTKGKTTVLDVHTIPPGKPCPERLDQLPIRVSQVGLIVNSVRDGSSNGCRVTASDQVGSTQILWYDNRAQAADAPPVLGELLRVYRITVTTDDILTMMQELQGLIGDIEGIEIRIVGTQVVVDGKILVPSELRRLETVLSVPRYQGKVLSLAEISPVSQKLLARKMEESIAGGKDRPKEITVRVVNGRFFLEGLVDKQGDRQAAEVICKSFLQEKYYLSKGPKPPEGIGSDCVQMVRIRAQQPSEPDPIVSVRVDFVKLNREFMKNFEFSWAPTIGASAEAAYSTDLGRFVGSFTATLSSLFPKLHSASSNGHARILKSAHLLVRDGADAQRGDGAPPEAKISEVIQIPYTLRDAQGNEQLQFQEVRTQVSLRVKSVAGSDKLNLDVLATQAELRGSGGGAGQQSGTVSNEVKTSLVVGDGESAALGGLVSERKQISNGRKPSAEAGNTFSLFSLDKKHDYLDSKEQFIVFITPEKIRSPSEGTERLKRKFRLRK